MWPMRFANTPKLAGKPGAAHWRRLRDSPARSRIRLASLACGGPALSQEDLHLVRWRRGEPSLRCPAIGARVQHYGALLGPVVPQCLENPALGALGGNAGVVLASDGPDWARNIELDFRGFTGPLSGSAAAERPPAPACAAGWGCRRPWWCWRSGRQRGMCRGRGLNGSRLWDDRAGRGSLCRCRRWRGQRSRRRCYGPGWPGGARPGGGPGGTRGSGWTFGARRTGLPGLGEGPAPSCCAGVEPGGFAAGAGLVLWINGSG
jgi:hypothetical protein